VSPAVIEAPSPDFAAMGPVELQEFLSAKAQELAQLQAKLETAHEQAESAEFAWVEHLDLCIEGWQAEHLDEKLPGEENRASIARRQGQGREMWEAHRSAERAVKRLEKAATLIDNQISAAQSAAKLLRAVET
jgi:hypothetical protein